MCGELAPFSTVDDQRHDGVFGTAAGRWRIFCVNRARVLLSTQAEDRAFTYELIIVDDGSPDKTSEVSPVGLAIVIDVLPLGRFAIQCAIRHGRRSSAHSRRQSRERRCCSNGKPTCWPVDADGRRIRSLSLSLSGCAERARSVDPLRRCRWCYEVQ